MKSAQEMIEQLGLIPHPEGGYFKETYRAGLNVYSDTVDAARSAVTCIYFMLTAGQISRLHKVEHDEIWHFYAGAPLRLIDADMQSANDIILGDYQNALVAHYVIPANHWQAAESTGEYSLVGCTVSPGFDFEDFAFLSDYQDQDAFKQKHPNLTRFI